jgi:DNA-binding Lrp family transcriptional regulator
MSVPFYMLLRTKIGENRNVVHAAQKIEGVKVAHSVMGNFDVILYAEAKSYDDIRRIRDAVHQINAVTQSETAVHI